MEAEDGEDKEEAVAEQALMKWHTFLSARILLDFAMRTQHLAEVTPQYGMGPNQNRLHVAMQYDVAISISANPLFEFLNSSKLTLRTVAV